MAVAMITLGTSFFLNDLGWVALLSMLLYIAGFALSWGPVVWVLLSELFPNAIRSKAMAIAVSAQWISNYVVSFTFPILDNNPYLIQLFNHGFSYWLYGLMALFAALFMWKLVPETKGKSLEALEAYWK
jgi:SP family xylose:H+ symportor-like MFS transporter